MTDIRKYQHIIDAINAILDSEGIAEVKWEKTGLTVVQIKRTYSMNIYRINQRDNAYILNINCIIQIV